MAGGVMNLKKNLEKIMVKMGYGPENSDVEFLLRMLPDEYEQEDIVEKNPYEFIIRPYNTKLETDLYPKKKYEKQFKSFESKSEQVSSEESNKVVFEQERLDLLRKTAENERLRAHLEKRIAEVEALKAKLEEALGSVEKADEFINHMAKQHILLDEEEQEDQPLA